jgi:hypothetical protein
LTEALLIRLGGDSQSEVADFELGFSEERGGLGALQSADHRADFRFDELREFSDELLGGDILLGKLRFLHDSLTDKKGGFLGNTPGLSFVYKDSTNFRDAHTWPREPRLFL